MPEEKHPKEIKETDIAEQFRQLLSSGTVLDATAAEEFLNKILEIKR